MASLSQEFQIAASLRHWQRKLTCKLCNIVSDSTLTTVLHSRLNFTFNIDDDDDAMMPKVNTISVEMRSICM